MNKRYKKYTDEIVINEAKKYEYRSDFKKTEPNMYKYIFKNNLFEKAFEHMLCKPKKWNKDKCVEVAKKCKTKSEFQKRYCGAYKSAKIHGWLNEIVKNFEIVGNKAKRCIYAYEFSDNHVYVGLTCNIKQRNTQHLNNKDSAVFQYIQKTKLTPVLKQVTEYIDYKEASIKEGETLDKYIKNNWNVLNKTKTGGLGSSIEKKVKPIKTDKKHWNFNNCSTVALKYTNKKDFRENEPSAYTIAIKNKWLDKICSHMPKYRHDDWDLESAKNEALKYTNKKDFRKYSKGCYGSCVHKGWIDIVCSHMKNLYEERKIYNEQNVKETLSKYSYMEQLKKSDDKFVRGCYWWMKKNKLLSEYKKFLNCLAQ